MSDPTECVLGADSVIARLGDDRALGGFLTLRANGVATSTGRQVFHPGQGELRVNSAR